MRSVSVRAAVAALVLLCAAGVASAHVSISSGPATANKSQQISFGIGHGCEGLDTLRVRVAIPAGITSVRALRSDFGKPTVERDGDVVIAVSWEKPASELLAADDGYYELTLRARVGDVPFSKIVFDVHQVCVDAEGAEVTADWTPELLVVPSRQPGWNAYTLGAAMLEADIGVFFSDAVIVWRGASAFSANANIAALIATTPGVSALTGDLAAGDELWVRY